MVQGEAYECRREKHQKLFFAAWDMPASCCQQCTPAVQRRRQGPRPAGGHPGVVLLLVPSIGSYLQAAGTIAELSQRLITISLPAACCLLPHEPGRAGCACHAKPLAAP